MLRRACTIYCTGPAQVLGAASSGFPSTCLPYSTGEDNSRQDMPPYSLVGQAVSQGTSKEGRKPRDPRNSHLKRNLFISLWALPRALLFHHGYQSPFLDSAEKNNGQPPSFAPSMRCWTRHRSPGPGLPVPCCSAGNHKHKYSVSHTVLIMLNSPW